MLRRAGGSRRRRRVRRRDRPLPRPPRRRPPSRRPAGDRARRSLRRRARPGTTSSSRCGGPRSARLADTFRERWEDPSPLDHRNPIRVVLRMLTRQPRHPDPLPPPRPDPAPCGTPRGAGAAHVSGQATALPIRARGERSIARAYLKAIPRARRLIYFEDQYFWSTDAAGALADALRAQPRAAHRRGGAPLPRRGRRGERATPRASVANAPPRRSCRGRRGPRPRVRPRERGRHTDLRARQGLRHRRRVGDGRVRQREPAIVDPRLGAVMCGHRRRARRSRTARPRRPR